MCEQVTPARSRRRPATSMSLASLASAATAAAAASSLHPPAVSAAVDPYYATKDQRIGFFKSTYHCKDPNRRPPGTVACSSELDCIDPFGKVGADDACGEVWCDDRSGACLYDLWDGSCQTFRSCGGSDEMCAEEGAGGPRDVPGVGGKCIGFGDNECVYGWCPPDPYAAPAPPPDDGLRDFVCTVELVNSPRPLFTQMEMQRLDDALVGCVAEHQPDATFDGVELIGQEWEPEADVRRGLILATEAEADRSLRRRKKRSKAKAYLKKCRGCDNGVLGGNDRTLSPADAELPQEDVHVEAPHDVRRLQESQLEDCLRATLQDGADSVDELEAFRGIETASIFCEPAASDLPDDHPTLSDQVTSTEEADSVAFCELTLHNVAMPLLSEREIRYVDLCLMTQYNAFYDLDPNADVMLQGEVTMQEPVGFLTATAQWLSDGRRATVDTVKTRRWKKVNKVRLKTARCRKKCKEEKLVESSLLEPTLPLNRALEGQRDAIVIASDEEGTDGVPADLRRRGLAFRPLHERVCDCLLSIRDGMMAETASTTLPFASPYLTCEVQCELPPPPPKEISIAPDLPSVPLPPAEDVLGPDEFQKQQEDAAFTFASTLKQDQANFDEYARIKAEECRAEQQRERDEFTTLQEGKKAEFQELQAYEARDIADRRLGSCARLAREAGCGGVSVANPIQVEVGSGGDVRFRVRQSVGLDPGAADQCAGDTTTTGVIVNFANQRTVDGFTVQYQCDEWSGTCGEDRRGYETDVCSWYAGLGVMVADVEVAFQTGDWTDGDCADRMARAREGQGYCYRVYKIDCRCTFTTGTD